MGVLSRVRNPSDLRALNAEEIIELSAEVREFLVDRVTKTGGHLGPNLGVVELTIALHRVFDSPKDPILWDTGHQTYVHKMFTGRLDDFATLRQQDGLSGYPSRAESSHDVIENSHASTALSYADGIAKAFQLQGHTGRHVVAVVGDGALTGGMTWEAINNIADGQDRSVIIVVNDNERSYSPTIGGLAHHLATLRTTRGYERFLDWGKSVLERTPVVGAPMYEALHGMKKGIKDIVAPQGMFEDLGIKYIGPVDGHDVGELEFALERARDFGGPVIVHAITTKGRGYEPAENDEADRFHAVGVVDPDTGKPLSVSAPNWTSSFADKLVVLGKENQNIVAITAAMLGPTGLDQFSTIFPERTFDVGIAEQHAVTSAAGMAYAGLHPVVAVYATFLNRAFDQVLMDCALHNAGVTFVLDRAGITGDDGASHNGMWDMALMRIVPNIELAAPRDGIQVQTALARAVAINDRPTVIRFPKGALPEVLVAQSHIGNADVLLDTDAVSPQVTIVSVGAFAHMAVEAARKLNANGIPTRVIDPVWCLPVSEELLSELAESDVVITIEDGLASGGVGAAISELMATRAPRVLTTNLGISSEFLQVAKRNVLLSQQGLTEENIIEQANQLIRSLQR